MAVTRSKSVSSPAALPFPFLFPSRCSSIQQQKALQQGKVGNVPPVRGFAAMPQALLAERTPSLRPNRDTKECRIDRPCPVWRGRKADRHRDSLIARSESRNGLWNQQSEEGIDLVAEQTEACC